MDYCLYIQGNMGHNMSDEIDNYDFYLKINRGNGMRCLPMW